jgi:uncharacterized protein (TIGR02271 family)
MKTVVGLLNSRQEARTAIEELNNSGFQRDAINIMVNENERQQFMGEGGGYSQVEGAETRFGFLSGGTAPLTGMGVLEQDAEFYNEGVNRGGYLVTVSCDDDKADEASAILRRCGAVDIDERAKSWRQEGWSGYREPEALSREPEALSREPEALSREPEALSREPEALSREPEALSSAATREREGVIPVVEEEIQVGKRQIQTGGVRVYSRISEIPVEEQINLREEHAKVERRPVDRPASELEREAFQERSFEIRETAEEPVISKQARVTEEVVVGTEASERTEVVRDTVRRTDVEVENLEGGQARDVSAMDDDEFHRHFVATYGGAERFDEPYRSAYHFAESESSSHPQFRNKDWSEVEENIHEDWERSHPGTWSKVQEAIHFGWDRTRRH